MKLKKGDHVKIVLGKDKGREGKIGKVFPKTQKVLIANVNQYKRHLKAKSQREPSEIVVITKPLPVYNVALICPHCKLSTRVGFKIEKNDKSSTDSVLDKIRVCSKCDKKI